MCNSRTYVQEVISEQKYVKASQVDTCNVLCFDHEDVTIDEKRTKTRNGEHSKRSGWNVAMDVFHSRCVCFEL